MASEPVRVRNYLDAADTHSTLAAVQKLGAIVERRDDEIVIRGCGLRNAIAPGEPIDVGNAGTLMRLLPGLARRSSRARASSSTATTRSAGARSTGSPSRCR